MINITEGGYYQNMGRGVVAGPSLVLRNSRIRTDIINFVPPSIEAGCGGIDMFLGSFSFINATQFVNLLQSIASNAAGYAFKIALATMCPTCDEAMTSLQKVIQQMNSMAGDSCRIAQTAVNFMADQAGANELSKSMEQGPLGSIALAVGAQADAFSAYLDKLGRDSNTKSLTSDEVKEYLGNIAWKVLQKNGYITTAFLSGDADMAEALMSFTGTIIGYKAGSDDPTPTIKEYPSLLTAKDLLRGGSSGSGAKKYNCSDHVDCLGITTGDYTFKGLETYVAQTLLGAALDAGSDSFIYKLISNSGALTMDEKRLIRVSPYHTTRLRNMAICTYNSGVGSLAQYSQKAARLIALEILQKYLQEAVTSIYAASQTGTNIGGYNIPYGLTPKFIANLKALQKQVQDEFQALDANLASTLEQIYQAATINCNLKPVSIMKNGG
jgi:conjugative transfer pilus assembly protein TraH